MSLRPPNPPKINPDDLQPGDILLSCGNSVLDRVITFIDQGDYSHTSQYIGLVDGVHKVVEATEEGVKFNPYSVDKNAQDLIDAYRYVSPKGHHFGDPGWPVDPVLDEAMSYVGANYAYSELILGAVVIMACELPDDPAIREAIRLLGEHFLHELEEWLNENKDKTPMTCVQVATSAHWLATATPANKYGLQVNINGARKNPFKTDEQKQYNDLRSQVIFKMSGYYPGYEGILAQRQGITVMAGSPLLPLGSCTPRDMETSPTLKFVGCLKDTRNSTV